ncbi:MAG: HEPN domain-containing protein [Candidatus Aenigmarchaeota archaeon]|nr:HEPN domain-containing protein [Candidatus Aenigmarchaeota archaeon]
MTLKGKIIWCSEQKSGIKIVRPNDNLSEAYLKKANEALRVMNKIRGVSKDWSVSSAYYARYNAIYALLVKCGIKSEIHDCTLVLFRFLFDENFDENLFDDIDDAKEQRINTQYYTNRGLNKEEYQKNVKNTPEFVLELESFIPNLTKNEIKEIRLNLKKLIEK